MQVTISVHINQVDNTHTTKNTKSDRNAAKDKLSGLTQK